LKVGFIGAGRVGSSAAYTLILLLNLDEIVLVDIAEELARGEALDLTHASYALGKPIRIDGGSDYSLLEGCDLIIVSAGVARKPGMSRLDLLQKNAEIMKDIAERLRRICGDAIIITVTNPVDLITYILWRELNIPRSRIFGMGSILDTARLWSIIGEITQDRVLGEHGDGMFILGENRDLEEAVKGSAMEVIKRKGATIYGPAAAIYRLAKAVLTDSREILPVSAVLEGEYGLKDVAIGVPAKIGRTGIVEIIEIEEAREKLRKSARILRDRLREIGY